MVVEQPGPQQIQPQGTKCGTPTFGIKVAPLGTQCVEAPTKTVVPVLVVVVVVVVVAATAVVW